MTAVRTKQCLIIMLLVCFTTIQGCAAGEILQFVGKILMTLGSAIMGSETDTASTEDKASTAATDTASAADKAAATNKAAELSKPSEAKITASKREFDAEKQLEGIEFAAYQDEQLNDEEKQ